MSEIARCPSGYRPGCCCSIVGLEPDESCPVHGWPDPRVCVYCGRFVSRARPCKRCGCDYHCRTTVTVQEGAHV